jgi:hypothetical protein
MILIESVLSHAISKLIKMIVYHIYSMKNKCCILWIHFPSIIEVLITQSYTSLS